MVNGVENFATTSQQPSTGCEIGSPFSHPGRPCLQPLNFHRELLDTLPSVNAVVEITELLNNSIGLVLQNLKAYNRLNKIPSELWNGCYTLLVIKRITSLGKIIDIVEIKFSNLCSEE